MSWPRPLNFWPIRTVFQGFQIHNVSLVQVIQEIQAVKVEQSKKKLNLLSKTGSFFDRSTLTPVISRATYATEKLYTSLESPNIQFFGGLKA